MKRAFDILGWIGVFLVIAAFGVRFGPLARFVPANSPGSDRIGMWLAWAGLACVLLYTASQWREIRTSMQRRQTRYGTLASVSVIVVLLILIAANYLSTRRHKRWDLTENAVNSLSEQSDKVLGGLDAPMKFMLFDQNVNFDRHRERLSRSTRTRRETSPSSTSTATGIRRARSNTRCRRIRRWSSTTRARRRRSAPSTSARSPAL
jgi:hypothetical protein